LAAAGYHVVAPDMRGYGKSDKPHEITAYNQIEIVNDVIGLIGALGYDNAIVIGHDWGAPIAWTSALLHPDKVRAVGGLSVPFMPRSPVQPMPMMREMFKGQFFYQLYFQEPGVAEAEFEKDIKTGLRKFLVMAGGETDLTKLTPKTEHDDLLTSLEDPKVLPPWLSEADLDFYAGEFSRSGMRGPLNWYRNHDLTWELTKDAPTQIHQPAMYVAGTADGVVMMAALAIEALPANVTDLRINKMIPGIGHWTQQEAPEVVNESILEFLKSVDG
jgi:pimeloyl-ACP methyl ester carboxylesterase